jgi:NADPH-dependent ferric siderophore reductase
LARLPKTLNPLSYAKYLTIAKTTRQVLRNYSVRAYRPDGPDGPELDVDFVLHGSAEHGTAGRPRSGPAAARAG